MRILSLEECGKGGGYFSQRPNLQIIILGPCDMNIKENTLETNCAFCFKHLLFIFTMQRRKYSSIIFQLLYKLTVNTCQIYLVNFRLYFCREWVVQQLIRIRLQSSLHLEFILMKTRARQIPQESKLCSLLIS